MLVWTEYAKQGIPRRNPAMEKEDMKASSFSWTHGGGRLGSPPWHCLEGWRYGSTPPLDAALVPPMLRFTRIL